MCRTYNLLEDCTDCNKKSFLQCHRVKNWIYDSALNPKEPWYYGLHSTKRGWFYCDDCPHVFSAVLNNVSTFHNWCPYCTGLGRMFCGKEQCSFCFTRSFAEEDIFPLIWGKYNLEDSKPWMYKPKARHIGWFDCTVCNHSFKAALYSVTKGSRCPFCAEPCNRLCEDARECDTCLVKTFFAYPHMDYWAERNGKLKPWHFTISSNESAWFVCRHCFHEYNSKICDVTGGTRCPYCAHKDLCKDVKGCRVCFSNIFASVEKVIHLTKNNSHFDPLRCFKGDNLVGIEMCCKKNHVFMTTPYSVTAGRWCPDCVNRTETVLYDFLLQSYKVKSQARFDWCKNPTTKRLLPFDFVIEKYKILIELDGAQHFRQVSNWKTPEHIKRIDVFKMKLALENGYSVVRMKQEDVYYNTIDWKGAIVRRIALYSRPIVRYVWLRGDKDYDKYRADMK